MQLQAFANNASIRGATIGVSAFLKKTGDASSSLYHLEQQIQSAALLGSVKELAYWVQTYVSYVLDRFKELFFVCCGVNSHGFQIWSCC
jgi:hypothetical protein